MRLDRRDFFQTLSDSSAAPQKVLFFHRPFCGPLGRFHHKPDPNHCPKSKLEVAYHKADKAIQGIVELLAAA